MGEIFFAGSVYKHSDDAAHFSDELTHENSWMLHHEKPAHVVIKKATKPLSATRERKLSFTAQIERVPTAKCPLDIGGVNAIFGY